MGEPRVRIVVPYYAAPERLARLLAALDVQTAAGFEVVVADDGSPAPPEPGAHPYPVRVVRQPDAGFRAAAARNLGARADTGAAPDLLLFLDADMAPTPTYVAAMTRALRSADVVVGRRRHAELTGVVPDAVRAWLTSDADAPPPGRADLGEPAWLAEGYAATNNLAELSDDGFRYVISAVLGARAETFAGVGGFEESFSAYGGEDWEFGHRAWLAGARFAYTPGAVAWHDGPDWAGRADTPEARAAARAAKNREALAVADLVPSPRLRDPHRTWTVPRIVVELDEAAREFDDPVVAFATAADLLRGSDARVVAPPGAPLLDAWPAADPGVVTGLPPTVLARVPYRVRVHAPVRLDDPGALTRLADAGDAAYVAADAPVLTLRQARSIALGVAPPTRPWPLPLPLAPPDLEARWGGWG